MRFLLIWCLTTLAIDEIATFFVIWKCFVSTECISLGCVNVVFSFNFFIPSRIEYIWFFILKQLLWWDVCLLVKSTITPIYYLIALFQIKISTFTRWLRSCFVFIYPTNMYLLYFLVLSRHLFYLFLLLFFNLI